MPNVTVEPQHIAMARMFMMPTSRPRAVGGMGRPAARPRPVTSRAPLSPNMTSFVESPMGQQAMSKLMGMMRQRRSPGAQQVNTIGQV